MTGKRYYLTKYGDWKRTAHAFANSHWFVLKAGESVNTIAANERPMAAFSGEPAEDATIVAVIEADEGAHAALEGDAGFEPLPHPLSQKRISAAAQAALSGYGILPGASTLDVAEAMARAHPLLGHRLF